MISVTRKSHFNAAHRLHNNEWSDEKNNTFKFESLRKEVFEKVLNFTNINDLPERKLVKEVEALGRKIVTSPVPFHHSRANVGAETERTF